MADFNTALAAGIAALDELCLWQGQPTVTSRLAGTITQAQYDAVVAERDARQAAITAMKAAANAEKAADAASVAGQGVLDASGGF